MTDPTADDLLAEVDIRTTDGTGRWTGDYKLLMSDPELARRLAAEVRALRARGTASDAVIRRLRDGWKPYPDDEGAVFWSREGFARGLSHVPDEPMSDEEWAVLADADRTGDDQS